MIRSMRPTRGGVAALAGALAVAAVLAVASSTSVRTAMATEPAAADPAAWLSKLNGKHRQLFDSPAPGGGIPLVHIMNYYDTYNRAFNVKDKDVNAVGTFYGSLVFHGLNDQMWAKYRIGEFLETVAPSGGTPATANPWRTAPQILGMSLPQASIESLQKRGATFIICNNALGIFSGMLAKSRGLDANSVYEDMKANILPGVTLVPAMVIAIEQAQSAGIRYHRQ